MKEREIEVYKRESLGEGKIQSDEIMFYDEGKKA